MGTVGVWEGGREGGVTGGSQSFTMGSSCLHTDIDLKFSFSRLLLDENVFSLHVTTQGQLDFWLIDKRGLNRAPSLLGHSMKILCKIKRPLCNGPIYIP